MTSYLRITIWSCIVGFILWLGSMHLVCEYEDGKKNENLINQRVWLQNKTQHLKMDYSLTHQGTNMTLVVKSSLASQLIKNDRNSMPVLKYDPSNFTWIDVVGDQVEEIKYKGETIWRKDDGWNRAVYDEKGLRPELEGDQYGNVRLKRYPPKFGDENP